MTHEQRAYELARQQGLGPMTFHLIETAHALDQLIEENQMRPDPPAPNTANTGRIGKYRPLVPPDAVRRDSRLLAAAATAGGAVVLAVEAVLAWLI